ncbi:DUF92 domain-containing protein [Neobacillus cucumis]|uniref:DUF92 domain-containing protein n=1 Tax=Neobacillus cucumis TaxID=1740721 RepID=UPI001EF97B72|nr:DUF92 domain-containing protein [Neobacillus cucumis]MBM7651631.1 uncharacterized protein (TIGR00297 family) [Neobacillus cucumis]
MIVSLLIAIVIIVGAISGYLFKSLTLSGAFAAILVGLSVNAGFGLNGLALIGAFFVSSNYWSKYKSSVKREIEEKLAKGGTRDWLQVFANGGAASFFSLLYSFQHEQIWMLGFMVCLASANSDTWASEIGSLSRKKPIYIRTFKRIERGTSGAISGLGTAAAFAGAFFISILSYLLFDTGIYVVMIVFLFGFIGNVLDTLFGAFYQQLYICVECGITTEKKKHCQIPTKRIKGFTMVDNDMVNFLSGFIAAVLSIVIFRFF